MYATEKSGSLYDKPEKNRNAGTSYADSKAGEVILKVEYVGVCGSDVHFFETGVRKGNRFHFRSFWDTSVLVR